MTNNTFFILLAIVLCLIGLGFYGGCRWQGRKFKAVLANKDRQLDGQAQEIQRLKTGTNFMQNGHSHR